MKQLTDYEKALIKAYKEAVKSVKIYTPEGKSKLKGSGLTEDAYSLGFHDGFKAATNRQEAEIDRLRAENKHLSERVDDLKMDIGFLRDSI